MLEEAKIKETEHLSPIITRQAKHTFKTGDRAGESVTYEQGLFRNGNFFGFIIQHSYAGRHFYSSLKYALRDMAGMKLLDNLQKLDAEALENVYDKIMRMVDVSAEIMDKEYDDFRNQIKDLEEKLGKANNKIKALTKDLEED